MISRGKFENNTHRLTSFATIPGSRLCPPTSLPDRGAASAPEPRKTRCMLAPGERRGSAHELENMAPTWPVCRRLPVHANGEKVER